MTAAAGPLWVLVALGANLDDPRAQLITARRRLAARFGAGSMRASSLWRSRPLDCPDGSPDFLNAVVAFPRPEAMSAEGLLAELARMETEQGRQRRQHHGPRPLDLDLLVFGQVRQDNPLCTLPHPRALERRFVLEPAAEILPGLIWPGTSSSIRSWRDALRRACRDDPGQAGIECLPEAWDP